jgi:hypothetical protein
LAESHSLCVCKHQKGAIVLLVIDEIVNAHPDATLIVHTGGMMNWHDLPEQISNVGRSALLSSGGEPGWIVKPLHPDADNLPSMIAARKLAPALGVVEAVAPRASSDQQQYKWGIGIMPFVGQLAQWPMGCFFSIVHSDGSILFNAIRLLGYTGMDQNRAGFDNVALDDKNYLHGVNRLAGRGDAGPPVRHALRVTNWLLPASTSGVELLEAVRALGQTPAPLPASWPAGKSQTILLHDQSPLVDWCDVGPDKAAIPSSPMLHVSVLVGGSLLIVQRGLTDFSAAEIKYDQEQAVIRARNEAWSQFQQTMRIFVRVLVEAGLDAGEAPPWISAPLNWWVSELTNES